MGKYEHKRIISGNAHKIKVSRYGTLQSAHLPDVSVFANAFAMTDHPDRAMLDRLRVYLNGASVSDIALKSGLAASTLTRVYNNLTRHRLSAPTMERLKDTYPGFFNDEDAPSSASARSYLEVDVLPTFGGLGGGGTGEGEVERALVPRRLIEDKLHATPKDLLIIECRGDSMHPDFQHGDQVMIDKRDTDTSQPGPFALWDGDGFVMKLVERMPEKRGWLRIFSINERYSAYEVQADEVRIMGRPVWYAREL